jgi:hypothetical protein
MQLASFPDLFAGKLCAALDRQHPRDLFDVKFLLDNEGLTDDLRKTFIVFLISHQRPMAELLSPNLKDISGIYASELVQITQVAVSLEELEAARKRLIAEINQSLTEDEKKFLISFKSMKPEWDLLGMGNIEQIKSLPSVRWKLHNLQQMPERKHRQALEKLGQILSNGN